MSLKGLFPFDKWNFATRHILDNLSPYDFDFLIGRQQKIAVKRGAYLFREGETPSGIFYIHKGKVKKFKQIGSREQILYVAGKGELFGYHAVLAEEDYPDDALSLEDCVVSFIPNGDLFELLSKSTELNRIFLKIVSHEFTVFSNYQFLISQGNATQRLATLLIIFREKSKDSDLEGDKVCVNIKRTDLAHAASMSIDTAIRLLKDWTKQKIIDTRGRKIWVKDLKKLVALTAFDS